MRTDQYTLLFLPGESNASLPSNYDRSNSLKDDDYLIWPEIISAMRSRISEASTSAIHLSPPHEVLTSQLRTITVTPTIHTSFAWLGYGTILTRSMVVEFLSLLRRLNATEDTMKMADNYFTILMNTVPEVWFDQNIELGGGQPFTVDSEGDERNSRHIVRFRPDFMCTL